MNKNDFLKKCSGNNVLKFSFSLLYFKAAKDFVYLYEPFISKFCRPKTVT